jgi:hypothetical protein
VIEALSRRRQGVAPAQRGVDEILGPDPFLVRLPESIAPVRLNPSDSGLAALAPFDHALDGLETVKVVTVNAPVTDTHRFADSASERHLDRRRSPGDGQARSGHQREPQLPGRVVHLLRPLPLPRQMFVVEDRHRAPAVLEDLDDLLEELVPRVKGLTLLVARITSMLADEQHAIDRKRAPSQGKRLRYGGKPFHGGKFLQPRPAHVIVTNLVDVDRDQIHLRVMVSAVPAIALEETIDDVLRMGVLEVRGADRGELGSRFALRREHEGRGAHSEKQGSPRDLHGDLRMTAGFSVQACRRASSMMRGA